MDLDSIGVDKHPHGFADPRVVTVDDRIDDRLAQGFDRILGQILAPEAADLSPDTCVQLETIGGGLISIWAAFLAVSPVMSYMMWRRFRRTVAVG
jgi:hypothetical protein